MFKAAPALAATVILFGCGSGETPGAAGAPAKPGSATSRKPQAGELVSPYMVSAVGSARTGSATVQLKFELRERPDVARPFDIDLVILPVSADLDRLSGNVEVGDGLELTEGAQIPPTERPAEGMPIRHAIKVLPRKDGIFTISAVVSLEAGGQSSSQTFTIPVIVGAGLPEAPAKPATTAATTKPAPAR